jgi:hypothetical protein
MQIEGLLAVLALLVTAIRLSYAADQRAWAQCKDGRRGRHVDRVQCGTRLNRAYRDWPLWRLRAGAY